MPLHASLLGAAIHAHLTADGDSVGVVDYPPESYLGDTYWADLPFNKRTRWMLQQQVYCRPCLRTACPLELPTFTCQAHTYVCCSGLRRARWQLQSGEFSSRFDIHLMYDQLAC